MRNAIDVPGNAIDVPSNAVEVPSNAGHVQSIPAEARGDAISVPLNPAGTNREESRGF